MVMLAAEGAGGFQQSVVAGVVHGMQIRQGSRSAQIRMLGDASDPRGAYWEEGRNQRMR